MPVAEKHHTAAFGPQRPRFRRRFLAALTGPALLLAITVGIWWKLVLTKQYTWLESSDIAYQVLPWFQFQAGEWHQGRWGLWDPFQWMGQPLIGQAQPGAAYPPNWLLFALPLKHGWIKATFLHWYFVLIHFLAALFAYLLCRDLGTSRLAAILGGVLFSAGGFMSGVEWPQMLNSALWTPLVFLFLLRTARGHRPLASAALSGAFAGIAWLGGHHQVPVFMTLSTGGVWLWLIASSPGRRMRLVTCAMLWGLFMAMTGAIQIWPGFEYGRLAVRWVGGDTPIGWRDPVPYTVHREHSAGLTSLIGIILPGVHRHINPFVGVCGIGLAALAIGTRLRLLPVRVLAAVGLAGVLLALGDNSIFHGVAYALAPMVEKARNPSAAFLTFNFAFAVLAALGADVMGRKPQATSRRIGFVQLSLAAFIFVACIALVLVRQLSLIDERWMVTSVAAAATGAILLAGARYLTPQRGLVAAALLVALFEIGNVAGYHLPHLSEKDRILNLPSMTEHSDIAAFLASQPEPFRVEINHEEIRYNFGDWYGIEEVSGYLAGVTRSVLEADFSSDRGAPLSNARFAVGSKPLRPGMQEVFTSRSGLKVWHNPAALPRVRVVHHVESVRSQPYINARIADPSVDLARTVILAGESPALEICNGDDKAQVIGRTSGSVRIAASLPCRGMLILADSFFPGWRVTVDGARARIWQPYGFLRGVVVESGKHIIEFHYRPTSVVGGAALTGLALLLALLIGAWPAIVRRRKQQHFSLTR